LDLADREKLEGVALERLLATADDDEQWSFLFRTSGAVDFLYCPWSVTEDWEFDGETEGLGLPWSPERLELIRRDEADPNEEELQQWRRAMCRKLAPGSDWCWIAWIVPLTIDTKIAGYALFVCASYGDPDDAPVLQGVFDTLEEAKSALTAEGAVAGAD
jgi:hypothetical protein